MKTIGLFFFVLLFNSGSVIYGEDVKSQNGIKAARKAVESSFKTLMKKNLESIEDRINVDGLHDLMSAESVTSFWKHLAKEYADGEVVFSYEQFNFNEIFWYRANALVQNDVKLLWIYWSNMMPDSTRMLRMWQHGMELSPIVEEISDTSVISMFDKKSIQLLVDSVRTDLEISMSPITTKGGQTIRVGSAHPGGISIFFANSEAKHHVAVLCESRFMEMERATDIFELPRMIRRGFLPGLDFSNSAPVQFDSTGTSE